MARTTFKNDVRVTGLLTQDAPTAMTPGSGTAGTGTIIRHTVQKMGSLIETRILVDLTGLNGGGTAADIIGVDGQANCHIGQITAAVNGTIFAWRPGPRMRLQLRSPGRPSWSTAGRGRWP
ncbi:MAG: hypothetical protein VW713_08405 [Alphaproteobacteria bacterium]